MKETYHVIGLMSGTSGDGLDMAYCEFERGDLWSYNILQAETQAYPEEIDSKIKNIMSERAATLADFHQNYGRIIGDMVNSFIRKYQLNPDFIASHGHTIFHQPQKGYGFQLGSGAAIAAVSGIKTIADFRSLDISLGGQGAPLVPIGDFHLFTHHDAFMNLGGIANISYRIENEILAFDIVACNLLLNYLSNRVGFDYDKNGDLASQGNPIPKILHALNKLDYYSQDMPKSLGSEWINQHIIPLLSSDYGTNDLLRTVVEHISDQIALRIKVFNSVMVTGGGAYNKYLIDRINIKSGMNLSIPEPQLIDFKEAMIFAFLGVLRERGEINTLKSVTGATKDSCGGCIYLP